MRRGARGARRGARLRLGERLAVEHHRVEDTRLEGVDARRVAFGRGSGCALTACLKRPRCTTAVSIVTCVDSPFFIAARSEASSSGWPPGLGLGMGVGVGLGLARRARRAGRLRVRAWQG